MKRIKYGVLLILGALLLPVAGSNAATPTLDPPSYTAEWQETQTRTIPVYGTSSPNPGVYWTQLDDGSFRATSTVDTKTAPNGGTEQAPYPARTGEWFRAVLDMSPYYPSNFRDRELMPYSPSFVTTKSINAGSSSWVSSGKYEGKGTAPAVWSGNPEFLDLEIKTGGPSYDDIQPIAGETNYHQGKKKIGYYIPMTLGWLGKVETTKILKVSPSANLQVGQTQQMKAEVMTDGYQAAPWTDVTFQSFTSWYMTSSGVVEWQDLNNGVLKAVAPGTTTVGAEFEKDGFKLKMAVTITVGGAPNPGGGGNGGGGRIIFTPDNTIGMQPPIVRDWSRKDVPVTASVVGYSPVTFSTTVSGTQEYDSTCGTSPNTYSCTKTRSVSVPYSWRQEADIGNIRITGDASGTNNVIITKEGDNLKLHGEVQWLPGVETWNLPARTSATKPTPPPTPPPITGDSGIYKIDKTRPVQSVTPTSHGWTNQPIVININHSDNLSGFYGTGYDLKNISYYNNNHKQEKATDKAKVWNPTITINQQGVYVLTTKLGDWAGWPEVLPDGPQTYVFTDYRYDSIPPYDAEYELGSGGVGSNGTFDYIADKNNYVRVRVGDELSGVVRSEFSWSKSNNISDPSNNNWGGGWNDIPIGTPDYATGAGQMSEWLNININSKTYYASDQSRNYDDMKEGAWYLHIRQTDRAGNVTHTVSPQIFVNKLKNLRIFKISDFAWKSVFVTPSGGDSGSAINGIGVSDMPIYTNKAGGNVSLGYGSEYKFDLVGFDGPNDKVVIKMDYHGIDTNGTISSFDDVYVEKKDGKYRELTGSEYSAQADIVTFNNRDTNADKRGVYESGVRLNQWLLPMFNADLAKARYGTVAHRTFLPPTTKFVKRGQKLDLIKGSTSNKYRELITFTIEAWREGHSTPLRYTFMEDQWSVHNLWGTKNFNEYGRNRPTSRDMLGLGVNHGEVIWLDLKHTLKDDLKYFREW